MSFQQGETERKPYHFTPASDFAGHIQSTQDKNQGPQKTRPQNDTQEMTDSCHISVHCNGHNATSSPNTKRVTTPNSQGLHTSNSLRANLSFTLLIQQYATINTTGNTTTMINTAHSHGRSLVTSLIASIIVRWKKTGRLEHGMDECQHRVPLRANSILVSSDSIKSSLNIHSNQVKTYRTVHLMKRRFTS